MASNKNDVAPDTGAIISTVLEWGLYGVSVHLFGNTVAALLSNKTKLNVKMLAIASSFFVLSTAHAVIVAVRLNDGMVVQRDTFPGGPAVYFTIITEKFFFLQSLFYVTETILADSVVIYRAYMVWQSIWVVIFPLLLWLACIASGVMALIEVELFAETHNLAKAFVFSKWINTFFGASLATNIIATSLLAWKIFTINRTASPYRIGGSSLRRVSRIILDSGMIYSVTLLITIILYTSHLNTQYIFLDMLMPIIPITFYMIIIRLDANSRAPATTVGASSGGTAVSAGSESHNMKRVKVHLTRTSDTTHSEGMFQGQEPAKDEWFSEA